MNWMTLRILVWMNLTLLLVSGCTNSGGVSSAPGAGGSSEQPVVDASGKKTYKIDPSKGAVLTGSGIDSNDPRFADVSVVMSSGALSFPVEVSLFEAQSLVSPSTSYVIGSSNLTAAGPSVAVLPSQSVAISGSLALSIPYSALTSLTGEKFLLVIAIYPGTSQNELETFVGNELDTNTPGIVKISTKKFGAFQVVYSDNVLEKKNVETTAEIRSIADAPPSPRVPILSYEGSTGTAGRFGEPMLVAPTKLENNGSPITGCGIKIPTTALPSWAAVNPNTCVISGTPNDALGSTTYTLVATNSAGQSLDAAVTLSVDPLIPTLNYADITAVGAVGTPMSVAPTTLQTNGADITACGIKSGSPALPSWASVNATTCVISGIPTAVLNPTSYTLVATNSAGQSADAMVTLSVSAGVPTLSYSGASGTTGRFGVAMSVAPQLLASNGATVTSCAIKFGSAALPAWASISGNTCLISGVPDALLSQTTYTVVATNSAGQSADASLSLSVGPSAPTLSYVGATVASGTFGTAMSISPTTLATNGAPITGCAIKTGTTALPSWATLNTSTCVISGTPNAVLNLTPYTIRAFNSAGASFDASVTLSVSAAKPTLSYSGSAGTSGTFGVAMSVSPKTLSANGAAITSCSIKSGTTPLPGWATVNGSTCVISGTPNAILSATTFTLVANNSAGQSTDATVSLSVGPAVPTLSYVNATGRSGTFGVLMSVTPTTILNNGASITSCGVKVPTTSLPAWASVDSTTCVISGTPNAALGSTTYTLVATNSAGQSSDATVSLSVSAAVPTLSYSGATGTSGTFGTAMSISPTTLSINGATITGCAVKTNTTALPTWATVNSTTCVISGTPNAILSSTSYTLRATNSVGFSTDASVSLSVAAAAPALSYTGSTGTVGTFGVAMSVAPKTLSNNGATVTACGIKSGTTPLPAWASVNSGTCVISGIPNAVLSTTSFTLVASNSAGQSADAMVNLSVGAAVPTLSYSGASGNTGTVGVVMSVTPTILSNNGAEITGCSIKTGTTALPTWATLTASTCAISGTPNAVLNATSFTIRATNSAGASSDATVSLLVNQLTSIAIEAFPSTTAYPTVTWTPSVKFSSAVTDTIGLYSDIIGTVINNPTVASTGTNTFVANNISTLGQVNTIYAKNPLIQTYSNMGTYKTKLPPNFSTPGPNGMVKALAVDTVGNLYVGGTFTTSGGVFVNNISKWNGSHWTALGTGLNGTVNALAIDSTGNLYAGGEFTTAGGVSVKGIAKWNGAMWASVGTLNNIYGFNTIYAIAIDKSDNVYIGKTHSVFKWNGTSWSELGNEQFYPYNVRALAVDSKENVYAGGPCCDSSYNKPILKWNGSSWSSLGASGANWAIETLAVDESDNLYAGGPFTWIGDLQISRIAKWNGSSWSSLSTGTNETVNKLVVDSAGNLYAGGFFTTAGGISASRIAKWDGSAWSALSTGVNNTVNALAIDSSGQLYVGGDFTDAGNVSVSNVAKWSSSTWSPLGVGLNGSVKALAYDSSGQLYVAGDFTSVGGIRANRIAKLDGSSWSALGSGLNGSVNSIAFDSSGNLYVGGFFTTAGGISAKRVAKWDGSTWSALGTGIYQSNEVSDFGVNAIAVDGSGNLYAGGPFTHAGGVTTNSIAKWNGSSWSALGTGFQLYPKDTIRDLAVDSSGNLYVGGFFTTAGGVSAKNVAKWDGTTWSALGAETSWTSSSVTALEIDASDNLYVGSSGVLKWNGSTWSNVGSGLNGSVEALALDSSGNIYVGGNDIGFSAAKWNGATWKIINSNVKDYSIKAIAADSSGNFYLGGKFDSVDSKLRPFLALWIDAFSSWF